MFLLKCTDNLNQNARGKIKAFSKAINNKKNVLINDCLLFVLSVNSNIFFLNFDQAKQSQTLFTRNLEPEVLEPRKSLAWARMERQ